MFVAGEWVGAASGETFAAESPATSEAIGARLTAFDRARTRSANSSPRRRSTRWTAGRTGWVNVNESTNYWESHLPFGGRAGSPSGIGRVGGPAPMDAFTELQPVVLS
jgi:acyl-CoA reductase-like NAD-dependent aldehyde dehydrogenase